METKQHPRPPGSRGALVLQQPWLELAGECAVRFFLSAALAAGEILGGYSPFALGYLSSAGAGAGGFFSLMGCGLGFLISKPLPDAFRYLATAILVYAVAFAFFDLNIYATRYFMPFSAALMAGLTGFVYLAEEGWTPTGIICYVTELLLVFATGRLFAVQVREEDSPLLLGLSWLTLAGGVLIALERIPLPFGLGLGRIAACAGAVWLSGVLPGASSVGAPLGLGLFLDLSAGGGCGCGASLAVGSLLSGKSEKQHRHTRILVFFVGFAAVSMWNFSVSGSLAPLLDGLLGCLLYLSLPASLLDRLEGRMPKHLKKTAPPISKAAQPVAAATGISSAAVASIQQRLRGQADAFHRLYQQLSADLDTSDDPKIDPFPLYLRASQRVCRGCAFGSACWKRDKSGMRTLLQPAMDAMVRRGRSDPADYPTEFSARCARINELVNEVNEQYAAARTRQRYQLRLKDSRSARCRQYEGMGHLLGDCALSLEPKAVAAVSKPNLTALAGVAAGKRPGQSVSGDAGGWFRDGDDGLWVVLCDGMGTGPDAARDSRFAYHLLEQFLSAGISPEVSLSTVAGALALRWESSGTFTTIDLLRIDLQSGEGCLYKLGAAPTYLRRDGVVSRFTSATLPAGLNTDPTPDLTRFRLRPGDLAVLVSDGVSDGSDDSDLRDAIRHWHGASPKELAASLLGPEESASDDRTAIVLCIGAEGIKAV